MNILVTGGAGFIGSHTVVELVANGFNPIIIDDFRNSERFIINRIEEITGKKCKSYDVDCLDISAMEKIFAIEKPEGVIHFAAYKAVGESVQKPVEYYDNNIGTLTNLLKLMPKYNTKHIVFSSSCTVYGEPDVIAVDESFPTQHAASPYGYTKQVCERLLMDLANTNTEIKSILLRYFNPIGAHPSSLIGELPIGVPNCLVPYVTQTAAGIREVLTVNGQDYNTPDGTCIRDYIHVVDLADAHVKALEYLNGMQESIDIFNVGTGKGTSVTEVVNLFEKATGVKVNHKYGPRRPGDVEAIYANNKKIVSKLGWEPKYTVEDALLHSWKWQETF